MQDNRTTNEKYLIFHTAGQTMAILARQISEILPMIPLVTVPTMPVFTVGFIDWDDGSPVLPVLRLDQLLHLPQPAQVPGLHTPIVVIRETQTAPAAFGLLVETVTGFVSAPLDPEEMQGQSFNDCVVSLLNLPGNAAPVPVLSVEQLLLAEEAERLNGFQQLLQERRRRFASRGEEVATSNTV